MSGKRLEKLQRELSLLEEEKTWPTTKFPNGGRIACSIMRIKAKIHEIEANTVQN